VTSAATTFDITMTIDESASPVVRWLGLADYESTWRRMQTFTAERTATTPDEIWFLQHPPVYTLGVNGHIKHVIAPGAIPVIQVDRGGQVTYHGPGQLVVYPLIDLRRAALGVRDLVIALEQSVIATVAHWGITALGNREAPGVYVEGRKIASVGLRVKRGCCYHGLAFNIAMDLSPFRGINPCGFEQLEVTQLSDLGGPADVDAVVQRLLPALMSNIGLSTRQVA
jgi:lipoyl(octanoyl) transferase